MKNTMNNTSMVVTNNVNTTDMIFRVCSMFDVPVFYASTSEVYGDSKDVPFNESSSSSFLNIGTPRWAYAQSKILGEALALYYQNSAGLRFITGRIFNSVGPGQNGDYGMVLPRFVQAATAGETLQVYGNGMQTRSFCHVKDTALAIYLLTQSDSYGEVYNIGGTEEVSMLDLANMVVSQSGSSSEIALVGYDEAYGTGYSDVRRRVPDTYKLKKLTGWKANYSLKQIIDDTIKEYND